jgi:transposase
MTFSHSRHHYVELVQDQTVSTWLGVHRNAFAFFGGVPHRIVLDYVARHVIELLCRVWLGGRRRPELRQPVLRRSAMAT